MKLARNIFVAFGVLIAFVGISLDYLLPGTSPGFNLPQLLIVAAGLAITLLAIQLRRLDRRRRLADLRGKTFAAAAIVTLLTLLLLEVILTAWGMPTYFPTEMPALELNTVPWWICDEAGCHFDYDAVIPACYTGELKGRLCALNRQGFSDSEDFIPPDANDDRSRILILGDSFTFGMSADLGMSFAEKLATDVSHSIVWNAGMNGAGTNQAVASFKVYGPLLRPQLTALGFYLNDFDDNLLPISSWWSAVDSDGKKVIHRKQKIDSLGNVVEFDINDIGVYAFHGKSPPSNELGRLLGMTRLGTLLLRLKDALLETRQEEAARIDRRLSVTRHYLAQLRDATVAQESSLLVLLIPRREDFGNPGVEYHWAIQLMKELNIAYLDSTGVLDPASDYADPPDLHWNNSGHQKAGALLSDCIEQFFASGDLADCDHVTLPSSSS